MAIETEKERLKEISFAKIAREIKRDIYNFAIAVKELKDAAEPFTRDDVVDETTGTIPFIERLEDAIKKIDGFMPEN